MTSIGISRVECEKPSRKSLPNGARRASEVLRYHLLMGKGVRPLLKGKTPEQMLEFITQQLEKREPFYTKAKHILDVNRLDNYEKIKISVDHIRQMTGV